MRGLHTLDTAPDYVSKLALSHPWRLTQGTAPGADLAAALHRHFAAVIEQNFARAGAACVAKWLDAIEARSLITLAQAYVNATEHRGRRPQALDILAHRLDPARLACLANCFGFARVQAAVGRAAPEKLAAFRAVADRRTAGPVPGEMNLHRHEPHRAAATRGGMGYLVFLDYTVEEIYLCFRSAPVGGTGVAAALFQAGLVVGTGVGAGCLPAAAIASFMTQGRRVLAPSAWEAMGDGVGWWVDQLARLPAGPGGGPAADVQRGQHQREGFMDIFQLDDALYDDFALAGGDHDSTGAWAALPYQPCVLPRCAPALVGRPGSAAPS